MPSKGKIWKFFIKQRKIPDNKWGNYLLTLTVIEYIKHKVYGNAWYPQPGEIEKLNGPVLFKTGSIGFKGVTHIPDREPGGKKHFSQIIEMAKQSKPPEEIDRGKIIGGSGHKQISSSADKIIYTIKNG